MGTLSKDMYYQIVKDMDIRDIIRLCQINKSANNKICQNEYIWRYRLNKEFPYWKDFKLNKSLIDIYILLYQLNILNKKFKSFRDIYHLYRKIVLDLKNDNMKNIPKEIGILSNLQEFDLRFNKLRKIPPEIGDLSNLQTLDLSNNKLTEIPKKLLKFLFYKNFTYIIIN